MRIRRTAAVTAAVAVALIYFPGANADEKTPMEIKACMKCQNKAKNAIDSAAKKKEWDKAAESSKTWLAAAGDLGKNKPPVGDDKSWKEQTEKYVSNVKAVDTAISKKDGDAVTKALATVGTSCKECHPKHRPK
jgi:cytochrome c556